MTTQLLRFGIVAAALLALNCETQGRGFGGFRGGSFGGYRGGESFGGYRGGSYSSFGGYRGGSYGGESSRYGGWGGDRGYAGGSYDRSYTDARGGSVSTEGTGRGSAYGPRGVAAGGSRDTTVTGANGRTYSSDGRGGFVSTPGGVAAGGSRERAYSGPNVSAAGGSRWGAAAGAGGVVAGGGAYHFASDSGLSHYAAVGGAGVVGHSTALWSNSAMYDRAFGVRSSFGSYWAFNSSWYTLHPGAWVATGWAADAAWATPVWATVATYINLAAQPVYYDYGSNVVYQNNNVYVDGADAGTAANYSQQASAIAAQGQAVTPPPTAQWQSLGVYALVQGDEKSSNNLFQLAVDSAGTIRGNYYDALMDQTTPVTGSVDKKTQRAAWVIGDKKTTVFETGIFNLTKDQTPVLVHFGNDRTQQWLLVRMNKPKGAGQ